jgi:hypothetical protein
MNDKDKKVMGCLLKMLLDNELISMRAFEMSLKKLEEKK